MLRKFIASLLMCLVCCSVAHAQNGSDVLNKAAGYGVVGGYLFKELTKKEAKALKQYTPGEDWPSKGYNVGSCGYHYRVRECSLQRFADQDSIFYLKVVKDGMDDGCFYYMFVDDSLAYIILSNTLNKQLVPQRSDRSAWYSQLLNETEVDKATDKTGNKYWTYYKPKKVFLKNEPDAIPNERVAGMGTQRFTYKVAERNYRTKHNDNQWLNFFIAASVMGYLSPNGTYHCNGMTFSNAADMEDYKNANGLK